MPFFRLDHDAVVNPARAENKTAALELVAATFANCYGMDKDAVLERLDERERLGSTGFGRRVAIPHGKIAGITEPMAVFLKLERPIEFDAVDGLPVDMVFGLLSPEAGGAMHLQALAYISRMLRNDRVRASLAGASDGDTAYAVLADVIDRDAA